MSAFLSDTNKDSKVFTFVIWARHDNTVQVCIAREWEDAFAMYVEQMELVEFSKNVYATEIREDLMSITNEAGDTTLFLVWKTTAFWVLDYVEDKNNENN